MWEIKLQLHGSGGSSSSGESKWVPNEYQTQVLGQMVPNYQNYNATSQNLLNNANNMYSGLATTNIDYAGILNNTNQTNQTAMNGFQNLSQGNVAGYTENETNALQTTLQNTIGTQLNGLANKGVINSSVMGNAMNDITKQAASTAASDYNNAISNANSSLSNMVSTGSQNIQNAQNSQNAAQLAASNLLTDSLSAYNAGSGVLGTNSGTATTSNSSSGNSFLNMGIAAGLGALACFAENTQVLTPYGNKAIKDIKVGDIVCSVENGEYKNCKVLDVQKPVKKVIVEVVAETENGERHFVETTASQPFMKENGEYIIVMNMPVGTELKCVGKVVAIMQLGEDYVYDLKVEGENNYIANGFIAYGRF